MNDFLPIGILVACGVIGAILSRQRFRGAASLEDGRGHLLRHHWIEGLLACAGFVFAALLLGGSYFLLIQGGLGAFVLALTFVAAAAGVAFLSRYMYRDSRRQIALTDRGVALWSGTPQISIAWDNIVKVSITPFADNVRIHASNGTSVDISINMVGAHVLGEYLRKYVEPGLYERVLRWHPYWGLAI